MKAENGIHMTPLMKTAYSVCNGAAYGEGKAAWRGKAANNFIKARSRDVVA